MNTAKLLELGRGEGEKSVRGYTQPELSKKLTGLDFAVCGKCETRLPSPSRGGFDDCPTCNPDGEDLATVLRLVGDQIHVDFVPVSDGVGLPPLISFGNRASCHFGNRWSTWKPLTVNCWPQYAQCP